MSQTKTIAFHNRDHFYQYVTMDGAEKILTKRMRQWSSPLSFNDPFDVQCDLGFPFKFEEFAPRFLQALEDLNFQEEEPHGDMNHPLFKMIHMSRRIRHKTPREAFRTHFGTAIENLIQGLNQTQIQANDEWKAYRKSLRILCLTESRDNLTMWAHYAEKHQGAVIRYKCLPDWDSALLAALPVKYSEQVPYIATMDEWIKHLTGQKQIFYDDHFKKLVTTKSIHWEKEAEWRVIDAFGNRKIPNDDGIHMIDLYRPEEIDEVYFGCNSNHHRINDIIAAMPPELSHVKKFIAGKEPWDFQLRFTAIG